MTEVTLDLKFVFLARTGGAFPPDAYRFVHQVVLETVDRIGRKRHATALEVLEGFRIAVERDFGDWGKEVLQEWGMATPQDVGKAVFELVEAGALSADSNDSPADFDLRDVALYREPEFAAAGGRRERNIWKGEWID